MSEPPTASSTAAPMSRLRGASVEVDARRVTRVLVGVALSALAVSAATLFVAGVTRNAQISDLRAHGVPVVVTVTGCMGLLGGSGSNGVGYACTGTYSYAGRRHSVAIPGGVLYGPGTRIRGVTAPDDPGLLSTPAVLAGERASASAFLVPGILSAVLGCGLGALWWRVRRRPSASPVASARSYAGGV